MTDNAVITTDDAIRIIEREIRVMLFDHGRIVQQVLLSGPVLSPVLSASRSAILRDEPDVYQISANGASPI
jgi:hypothetical protein